MILGYMIGATTVLIIFVIIDFYYDNKRKALYRPINKKENDKINRQTRGFL